MAWIITSFWSTSHISTGHFTCDVILTSCNSHRVSFFDNSSFVNGSFYCLHYYLFETIFFNFTYIENNWTSYDVTAVLYVFESPKGISQWFSDWRWRRFIRIFNFIFAVLFIVDKRLLEFVKSFNLAWVHACPHVQVMHFHFSTKNRVQDFFSNLWRSKCVKCVLGMLSVWSGYISKMFIL